MGKNSSIEWTHHTFNPWWGCSKVSPACAYCYAEAWARRVGEAVWGEDSPRRFFGEPHWREPVRWSREAERAGERRRVFCASMADVFELRTDLDPWRNRLWDLIAATPKLDWLLLTKRPENVLSMVPWADVWPPNVWLGTTVENQFWACQRIPRLTAIPACVRFLSCEPLLGPLDLSAWLGTSADEAGIHWVIAGGESGAQARPMQPGWVKSLRDQCMSSGVMFHFKQWGTWAPSPEGVVRLGKKAAGRELDGRTWDGVPSPADREEIECEAQAEAGEA